MLQSPSKVIYPCICRATSWWKKMQIKKCLLLQNVEMYLFNIHSIIQINNHRSPALNLPALAYTLTRKKEGAAPWRRDRSHENRAVALRVPQTHAGCCVKKTSGPARARARRDIIYRVSLRRKIDRAMAEARTSGASRVRAKKKCARENTPHESNFKSIRANIAPRAVYLSRASVWMS